MWSCSPTSWLRWLRINGKARKCENKHFIFQFSCSLSRKPPSCCNVKAAHAIFRTSKEAVSFSYNSCSLRWTINEMCCSWTGLTLHEDCTPSRMHLPVGPHSHSTLFPAVGFYQALPSQLTLGGSGRGLGCWCTEVRSRSLLVLPLIWHRSPLPAATQVHFCPRWSHLGTPNPLQQEVLNAGRVPLSMSELEYCGEQSKLKCPAAWLSLSINQTAFLCRSHKRFTAT